MVHLSCNQLMHGYGDVRMEVVLQWKFQCYKALEINLIHFVKYFQKKRSDSSFLTFPIVTQFIHFASISSLVHAQFTAYAFNTFGSKGGGDLWGYSGQVLGGVYFWASEKGRKMGA